MKITHITARGFLGARDIDLDVAPVTMICGPNGSGKSSVRDAIALALTADLSRVKLKGDAGNLVSDGAKSAAIIVSTDEQEFEVAITAAGKITDGAKGRETPPALPILLSPHRFGEMTSAERQAFLFDILKIDATHTAIADRLKRRGLDSAKIEEITPMLRGGIPSTCRYAKERASEARGAWKAITGEAYGSSKADGWKPAAVEGAERAAKLADASRKKADDTAAAIEDLQRQAGAIEQQARAAADARKRLAVLRELAAQVERRRGKLARDQAELDLWQGKLDSLPPEPGAAPVRAPMACPDCGVSIVLIDGQLRHYEAPVADDEETAIKRREWLKAVDLYRSSVANAERDMKSATDAVAEIATLEASLGDDDSAKEMDTIKARIAELKQTLAEWRDDERKHRDTASAADLASKAEGKAAAAHADVQQWSELAEALEPSGVQGEILADAIGPLNKRMGEDSDWAGFAPVQIGADMGITYSGRLYGLLSESERWRVDAVCAAAVAHFSGLRMVVLDRFDVLDIQSRGAVISWLAGMADEGELDTAIVLGTLKQAPKLPAGCASHWLGKEQDETPAKAA